jgi:hypothetical protein
MSSKEMKTANLENSIIDGYIRLLDNLSPVSKLDLISKLTQSVKSDFVARKKSFLKAFGGWDNSDSAEDLIANIRESRTFYRKTEKF